MSRVLCFAFIGLLPLAAAAQTTPPTCSAATLTGTRAITITGRDLSTATALTKTFQAVGYATFDGVKAVTLTLSINTSVMAGLSQTWTGTYTLASTCVGSMTTASGDSATFTLIAYNKGNGFTITGQDGTYALTGTGNPLPASCVTSSLSGAYAFSGNGFTLNSSGVTGVNTISGLLQFDGRGNVTGTWTLGTNGTSTSDAVTGKYAFAAQCQATATLTDPSNASWNVNFTITSADAGDVSFNMANATSMFNANGHSTFMNPGLSVTSAPSGGASATPPGSIFALYGSGLATGSTQANFLPLPPSLLGTSVTVNGEQAPLFYMSSGQINAQMPWDTQAGVATVVVSNGTSMSNSVAVNVPATGTPEIFLYGSNRAVVQNPNFSVNSSTAPAHVGETVVAYFSGGGPVNASGPLVSGKASPNGLSPVTGTPATVTVAGIMAKVTYMGLTPTLVGLYQVNFVIPQVAAGDRTITINIGTYTSAGAIINVAN